MKLNQLYSLLTRYLKSLLNPYTIIMVEDTNHPLWDEIFKFRYKLYCIIDKLLDKDNYPDGRESDEFDTNSIFFVAVDKHRKIIGLSRLILNSEIGLPTINEFDLKDKINNMIPGDTSIAEVSRFMILPEYRKSFLLIDLCFSVIHFSGRRGIKVLVGCVESWFLKTLRGLIPSVSSIGNPMYCFNAMNYPILINLENIQHELDKRRVMNFILKWRTSR